MKTFFNSLMICASFAACSLSLAIEAKQHVSQCMPKPDNAVNRRLSAAEDFPNTGWYDGKYWSIWADKQPVPAEHPELLWYALCDTAPSANDSEWIGRVEDWTTDSSGDVLIFFLNTLGNWSCGCYVVYRRNAQNMFEYAGRVFTGSLVGWFDMKGIELQKDGFVMTFLNHEDLPTIRHKFLYNNLADFVVPEHDYQVAVSPENERGQHVILCRMAGDDGKWLFRLADATSCSVGSVLLRNADGGIYHLPERVMMSGENSAYFRHEQNVALRPYAFRWLSAEQFRAWADDGSWYTWRLLPDNRIELVESGDSDGYRSAKKQGEKMGSYTVEFSSPNDQGQVLMLCRLWNGEEKFIFRLILSHSGETVNLLSEDGTPYVLPERVRLCYGLGWSQEKYYARAEFAHLQPHRFRWIDSTSFTTHSDNGTIYTWQILPDFKVRLLEQN